MGALFHTELDRQADRVPQFILNICVARETA
jgi:hypothetical protein